MPRTIRALFAKNNQSSLCPTHGDIESSRIGHETDLASGVAPHSGQQNHVTLESLKCVKVAHHSDSHSLALKVLVDSLHLRQDHNIVRIHIIRVGQDRSNSADDIRGFVVVLIGSATLDFASSIDIHEADGI